MSWGGSKPPRSITFAVFVNGRQEKNPAEGFFKATDAMARGIAVGTALSGGKYPLVTVRKIVNGKVGKPLVTWKDGESDD